MISGSRSFFTLAMACLLLQSGCLDDESGCEDECNLWDDNICNGTIVQECLWGIPVTACNLWTDKHDCADIDASCESGGCRCHPGDTLCGKCSDLRSDASNCGQCGQRCGAGSCVRGACVCNTTSATVQLCAGSPACVDVSSDPMHCGSCDVACAPGSVCVGGICS